MHPYLLKELAHEITPALTNLFNLSLEIGTVPVNWHCAAVSPIFKRGSKKLKIIVPYLLPLLFARFSKA